MPSSPSAAAPALDDARLDARNAGDQIAFALIPTGNGDASGMSGNHNSPHWSAAGR